MRIQLIRSATIKIAMADHTFIIDPYLSDKHGMPSYTGASPNPLVSLPLSPEVILKDCEMAVVSHIHSDHFDPVAQQLLPKSTPIICQPSEADQLQEMGFNTIFPVTDEVTWNGITFTRTPAQHGSGQVLDEMGQASGFIIKAASEPILYWAGDTIWTPEINRIIQQFKPVIIVTHSGGAVWGDNIPIIMDIEQTIALCKAAPGSLVIATHLEALDHCTVTRSALRAAAEHHGISSSRLLIPVDGECITLESHPANDFVHV